MSVESSTSLTLDAAADQTLSGVQFVISDPIDIEEGAMLLYLQREVEKQMRTSKRMNSTPDDLREYQMARAMAFDADARSMSRIRVSAIPGASIKNMPRGSDIT
jgi:hypothetical protein